jgi:predicted HTH transcriptional regulator
MREDARKAGLPVPQIVWQEPYLVLTIYENVHAAARRLKPELLRTLNDDEKKAWEFIARLQTITTPDLMKQFGFDERKAQRILGKLSKAKLISRTGKGRSTRYELLQAIR